jgi:hypothetical protein
MEEIIESNEFFEIDVYQKVKNSTYKVEDFTQSQSHGLFWDNEIREKVFSLPPCKNDTKKYDIECIENKFNTEENISIKTTASNNIDCGDILRFYNGDFTKKYTIILLRYIQLDNVKKIKEIIEINYNEELRNYLFGTITEDMLKQYVETIKKIPPGKASNTTKNAYKILKNKLQQEYGMHINISPKVDSKNQRRVQCSIPKIDALLELFPQNVISRTCENIIRGTAITAIINSARRLRK